MKLALIWSVRFYQRWVSTWLPPCCRFHPSCSEYTCQSLEKWGCGRGIRLALARFVRCHPWNPGGVDPVP